MRCARTVPVKLANSNRVHAARRESATQSAVHEPWAEWIDRPRILRYCAMKHIRVIEADLVQKRDAPCSAGRASESCRCSEPASSNRLLARLPVRALSIHQQRCYASDSKKVSRCLAILYPPRLCGDSNSRCCHTHRFHTYSGQHHRPAMSCCRYWRSKGSPERPASPALAERKSVDFFCEGESLRHTVRRSEPAAILAGGAAKSS